MPATLIAVRSIGARRNLLGATLLSLLWFTAAQTFAETPAASVTADEQAIRNAAVAFTNAYNAHDPSRIATLFTANGELVDPSGDAQRGHAAIEAVFAAVFAEYPDATTSVKINSIRFLSSSVAEEDGVATVVREPGTDGEPNRYTAIHLKQPDGNWLMASARDLPDDENASAESLDELGWMIGDWIDESPDALVVTSYQWSGNHRYILGQFTIRVAGKPVLNGTQRIGWDPLEKVIRNWVFDEQGGFTSGIWTREGNRWIIKQSGVTSAGEPATATNTITRLRGDRFQWESRDRVLGGEFQDDSPAVIVVRKPPEPAK